MTDPMRILIIDDDPSSRTILRTALAGTGADVAECDGGDAATDAVEAGACFDVIICDVMMPGVDGIAICRRLRSIANTRDVPIILLTADTSVATRHAAIAAGADDVLHKPLAADELGVRIAGFARQNRARRAADLRAQLHLLITTSPHAVVVTEAGTDRILYANPSAIAGLGGDLVGTSIYSLFDDASQDSLRTVVSRLHSGGTIPPESPTTTLTVTRQATVWSVALCRTSWEEQPAVHWTAVDITQEHKIQATLREYEQVTVAARLAAAVGHDLGSALQLAICSVDGLTKRPHPADAESVSGLRQALSRSALMLNQMMNYSRRQAVYTGGVCDPARVATDVASLFANVFDRPIHVDTTPLASPLMVSVAAASLEQVLVNLLSNAMDATPRSGRILVTVAQQSESAASTRITVADSGSGMDAATLRRVGEPFFTTKAEGKGTGLGLYSARGIIEAAHGSLQVTSDAGRGTTVTLLLPAFT